VKAKVVLLSLLLLVLIPTVNVTEAQSGGVGLQLKCTLILDQHYSIFGTAHQTLLLNVAGQTEPSDNGSTVITVSFPFTFIKVESTGLNETLRQGLYGYSTLKVTLPPDTSSFNFTIVGSIDDPSILYRSVAEVQPFSATMSTPFNQTYLPYSALLFIPSSPGIQIYSISPEPSLLNLNQRVVIGGVSYYVLNIPTGRSGVQVLYQQQFRDIFVLVFLVSFAFGLSLLTYIGRRGYIHFLRRFVAGVPSTVGLTSLTNGGHFERVKGLPLVLVRRIYPSNSRRWLALFVISCTLMFSVAFVLGPNPVPRAYLASSPTTTPAIAPYIQEANYTYLTPLQVTGIDKFDTMSTLASFEVVILADYPPPLDTEGLTSANHIVVLSQYFPASDLPVVQSLYPDYELSVVDNVSNLPSVLASIGPRPNPLGLHVSQGLWYGAALFEGVMSFVIVFFALGFFSSAVAESGWKGMAGIAESIGFSVFIFLFSQMVYIISSVFLGLPVGLHASTSHDTTAVGLLGFGGGTRPRMLSAAFGFIAGILTTREARIKLDFVGFFVFVFAGIFVLIDPLNVGDLFSQVVLINFSGVPSAGTGQQIYEGTRQIIGQFMSLFGDFASKGYFSQHGAAFFYVGAVPFALFSRLPKSVATLLALTSAYICGTGFVRISDMIPLKAIASVPPGLALGAAFLLLFAGLGFVEYAIRKRLVTR
jgi:hypothetical protein